jgi:hypothetical protein
MLPLDIAVSCSNGRTRRSPNTTDPRFTRRDAANDVTVRYIRFGTSLGSIFRRKGETSFPSWRNEAALAAFAGPRTASTSDINYPVIGKIFVTVLAEGKIERVLRRITIELRGQTGQASLFCNPRG